MKKLISLLCFCLFLTPFNIYADNTKAHIFDYFMNSTFKLQGENSLGTAFIMGMPSPVFEGKSHFVMITATHVLEGINGDFATIFFRKKIDTSYQKCPLKIRIRNNGRPIWVNHSDVDVSAMLINIPNDMRFPLISTDLLATDEILEKYEVRPGDQLFVLGYPYGAEANDAGFPILRSGRIASYPLSPTSQYKTFLLDFEVFGGNSGGPVLFYSENRLIENKLTYSHVQFIMGLVSQELSKKEELHSINETITRNHKLSIAVIINARYIKDLIDKVSDAISKSSNHPINADGK